MEETFALFDYEGFVGRPFSLFFQAGKSITIIVQLDASKQEIHFLGAEPCTDKKIIDRHNNQWIKT